ncbi:MAG: methylmalonyl Co-A mutase-associated GTPase MeaB [Acidimicrobiales bacterium]|nr:methylmalonyl Co-A mutase-associated GTPase MeaB [Acidimicrobiales bacterium]
MLKEKDPSILFSEATSGDRRSLGRLITMIEDGDKQSTVISSLAFKTPGHSHLIGITGAPGAGKSTLTSAVVSLYRKAGKSVAVLAIDPSSPFSGGAILGDRVRMGDHVLDPGVYVRSLATRGELGGLAACVPEVARLMDSMSFDIVIIETVGVGQVEVEIAALADTTVVVVNPGWGDAVQANKAGLMEIADIFVVNKSDRPGAKETVRDIEAMLDMSNLTTWRPPVCQTVGIDGSGAADLCEKIQMHNEFADESGLLSQHRSNRLKEEIERKVASELFSRAKSMMGKASVKSLTECVIKGELDPHEAAIRVVDLVLVEEGSNGQKS